MRSRTQITDQPINKFSAFYKTLRFINAFTMFHHCDILFETYFDITFPSKSRSWRWFLSFKFLDESLYAYHFLFLPALYLFEEAHFIKLQVSSFPYSYINATEAFWTNGDQAAVWIRHFPNTVIEDQYCSNLFSMTQSFVTLFKKKNALMGHVLNLYSIQH